MDSPFVTAIVVSSIGLVALCLALTVLFGLMYLLTLLKDRPAEEGPAMQSESRPHTALQAAAAAVALARAEMETSPSAPPSEETSNWWALHHQRQLNMNRFPRSHT